MEKTEISKRIQTLYPDAQIEMKGENCSFELLIVSERFEGMRALQRQQSILGLFAEELKTGKLHALAIKANTIDELANMPDNIIKIL